MEGLQVPSSGKWRGSTERLPAGATRFTCFIASAKERQWPQRMSVHSNIRRGAPLGPNWKRDPGSCETGEASPR